MGLLLYEFRTSNVILTVSEQRCLFSAILMPQFLIHEFKFLLSVRSFLSTNSCLRISKIRFIIPMFLMFIYISRYKDLFSSVFNVLGDFLLFNRPAVVHSHLFTLQFSQSSFSALKHFNYHYSHAMSQRQFNAASS